MSVSFPDQPASLATRASGRVVRARRTTELLTAKAEAGRVGDSDAMDRCDSDIILVNLGVAQAVAARYRRRGIDDDDLDQLAYEGLVKAVRRYDVTRAEDFLSFAVPTIRGEIQRYFRDLGWMVRPPRRIQELQWHITRSLSELEQRLGREPSPDEVCADLDIERSQYDQARQAYGAFSPLSLDATPSSESDLSWHDLICQEDPGHGQAEARLITREALSTLSTRDRRILHLRFDLDKTQREIGDELGVTQMQVSRLLQRILGDLRDHLLREPEAV